MTLQQSWHYKDEKSGQRLGPVDEAEIARLITDGRLDRASVVWNPQMKDWAKASTTDLASLFGSTPPPLPAAEISRWAIFTVALLPIWGLVIQAVVSSQLDDPKVAFDSSAWFLMFIAGNGLFGWLDERNLERAGLKVKGATIISAVLIPAYIYISCRTYQRHTDAKQWFAYAPVIIWVLAFVLGAVIGPAVFEQ